MRDIRKNARLLASRLVPVPFRSTYGVDDAGRQRRQEATWWQWRGRVFRHRNRFV